MYAIRSYYVYSLPAFDASESYSLAPSTVWKPASGKINLVWQTNFSHQITHDAINVIAPVITSYSIHYTKLYDGIWEISAIRSAARCWVSAVRCYG